MSVPVEDPKLNTTQVRISAEGEVIPVETSWHGWDTDIRAHIISERVALQNLLQHDERGVNVRRIAAFLGSVGLAMRPYSIAANVRDPEVDKILKKYDASFTQESGGILLPAGVRARHVGALGLVVVDGSEQRNDIEPSLVHEIAHANGVTTLAAVIDEQGGRVREIFLQRGLKTITPKGETRGSMAEEAFATLVEGGYRHSKADEEPYDYASVRVLGAGRIHPKYMRGQGVAGANVLGALGLEVLCASDPSVAETLLQARRTGKIVDLENQLDEISPGLGRRFRHPVGVGRIVNDDGLLFLRHALRATGTRPADVIDISEEDPFAQAIQRMHSVPPLEQQCSREQITIQPEDTADTSAKILWAINNTLRPRA